MHIYELPHGIGPFAKTGLVASFTYTVSATFTKLSVLAFYLRLSPHKTFRMLTYILIGVVTVSGFGSSITVLTQCIPLKRLWFGTTTGYCISTRNFYFANAGIHMFTELLIYILPIHTLWNVRIPTRQRIGLCVLMSIGARQVLSLLQMSNIG